MKKTWMIDMIVIISLAVILITLNESEIISIANHKWIYVALLAAYYAGRKISRWTERQEKESTHTMQNT